MKYFSFIFLLLHTYLFSGTGIYQSYVILDVGSINYYDAQANTSNPNFSGHIGTFTSADSFLLQGGEIKTWKDGSSDVTGAYLYYRIYPQGGTIPSFTEIILPWSANNIDGNPNNQSWKTSSTGINLLSGLPAGDYTMEVYFKSTTNEGDRFSNNDGNNYVATFSIVDNLTLNGIVTLSPSTPSRTEAVTITLDATGTELETASTIYFHSGVGKDKPNSYEFNQTVGNWGADDGVGAMTRIGISNTWTITLPNIDDYYSLDENDDAFSLNFLFRDETGTEKEDFNGANYHINIDPGAYFLLNTPDYSPYLIEVNTNFNIEAEANQTTNWILQETNEDGTIIISTLNTYHGGNFSFTHLLSNVSINHYYKLTADFGGGVIKSKTFGVSAYSAPIELAMPTGAKKGINYNFPEMGDITFVLHTPTETNYKYYDSNNCANESIGYSQEKDIIHLIGGFTNWEIQENFKLNKDGDFWWITLNPDNDFSQPIQNEYVFQYLVDGKIRIGDPYSHKISDPDDQFIDNEIYPNLIPYPVGYTNGRASVLELNQTEFSWQIPNFDRPTARNDLNVYELHFRDFTEEGTYKAATEKLDYLKELGINCIHVMPVSEFEGNDSWGYNPNYYFASDKAYGTPNDLKEFIDQAHLRGIAVINDLVLNHAFYSNPNAMLYWNDQENRPADDNPWFNSIHKAVYDTSGHWGADLNHASEHTQQMIDDILSYWIEEFKFDGFRFDFTKGFSQTEPDAGDPWASSYDICRIQILKRMVDQMWTTHPKTYAIFEHLANDDEDKELADYGILLWSGAGPQHSWEEMAMGTSTQSFWSSVYESRNFIYANYMSYMESHDEERISYKISQWGAQNDGTTSYLARRSKLVTPFNILLPGPRMIWQFGELGYDISINFNGRTGQKPSAWELNYDTVSERQQIYRLYAHSFKFRNTFDLYHAIEFPTDSNSHVDYGNIGSSSDWTRRMSFADNAPNGKHTQVIAIGNFDTQNDRSIVPGYLSTGYWYKYNGDPETDGSKFTVTNTNDPFTLYTNDPVYILSNADILPPVINLEPIEVISNYCNNEGNSSYDITEGIWTAGTTQINQAADNDKIESIYIDRINGVDILPLNSLQGITLESGENHIRWNAVDPSGNKTTAIQIITITMGDCHTNSSSGIPQNSLTVISTLNRREINMDTFKKNGSLVIESNSKGFVITTVSDTDNILNPVKGMIVFDKSADNKCLKLYDGNQWGCIKQKSIPK